MTRSTRADASRVKQVSEHRCSMLAERVDHRLRVGGVLSDAEYSTDLRPRPAVSPCMSYCFGECLVHTPRSAARLLHRAPSVSSPVASSLDPEAARPTHDPQGWLEHRDLRVHPAAKPSPVRLWNGCHGCGQVAASDGYPKRRSANRRGTQRQWRRGPALPTVGAVGVVDRYRGVV